MSELYQGERPACAGPTEAVTSSDRLTPAAHDGQGILAAAQPRPAAGGDRTKPAARSLRQADDGAELHEGLVPVAGAPGVEGSSGELP